jgi:DNA polymerase III delta prime subunit
MSGDADQNRRPKILKEIYEWANLLTGEMAFGSYEYIWTKPVRLLLERLKCNSSGLFIAVIGLQGVGKTTAAMAVASELQTALDEQKENSARAQGKDPDKVSGKFNVLHVKHLSSGSLLDSIERVTEDQWVSAYEQWIGKELQMRFKGSKTFRDRITGELGSNRTFAVAHGDAYLDESEKFLPTRLLKENKRQALENLLRSSTAES